MLLRFLSEPPKIVTRPPSVLTIKENQNVSVPCRITGFPKPEITWYKAGVALRREAYSFESGALKLSRVQYSDRGSYVCQGKSFLGLVRAGVKIVVHGRKHCDVLSND